MSAAENKDLSDSPISLPLTPRQSLIWIENSIQPTLPLNHVTVLGTIRGNIQPGTFEQAFAELVTRHEALRAKVIDTANGPRYCVPEEHVSRISLVDLSGEPDPSSAYQRWVEDRCQKILEFDQCLYDAALIWVHDEEFVFFLNQNHIISDGSSTRLLFRELGEIYLQILSGSQRGTSLAGVHPYSEFIQETSKYTTSEQSAKSRAFWSERFASSLPSVSYYGRNAANGKLLTTRITRRLGEDLSRAVRDLGRLKPPFIVFITVLIAHLRRVTLNDDICIGVPFHNRTPTFADTVGLLMEVVPYRISVDSEDTLDSLLRKVRNETRAIKEHRRHTISARLAPYDVILNYRPESLATFAGFPLIYDVTNPLNSIGSGQTSDSHSVRREGHESLRVEINHTDDDEIFRVTFDFDDGIWPDAAERERAADHFLTLIAAIVHNPSGRIDDIDILTDQEKELAIREDDSARNRREALPTVDELVRGQIRRRPDHPAIAWHDKKITYRELGNRIDRLSAYLQTKGVGAGSLVAVCLDRSPDLVVTLLAIQRARAAYIPIDPKLPELRIRYILEEADPAALVVEPALREKFELNEQDRIVCLDDEIWRKPAAKVENGVTRPEDLAYVIFTSGSTGRPKGVEITHHNLGAFLSAMAREPGLDENDRLLAVTTVSFDIAALELFLPLTVGATVHIAPSEAAVNANKLSDLLDEKRISVFQATPATFRMLIASGWQGSKSLKILCGGETLPPELADALIARSASVWNMFGPTESTVWSVIKKVEPAMNPVPIGRPIPGTQAYVLNDHLSPVPLGVPGELYLGGDGVARGYLGREDLTRERFLANPFLADEEASIYRTGDTVRMLPNGDLQFIGRRDFQVKVRGFRIELQEIEVTLAQHEAIRDCVLKTFTNISGEAALAAYVIPQTGIGPVSRGTVIEYLRDRFPTYMIPSVIVNLEEFPLTPNGKIDRTVLPAPGDSLSTPQESAYAEPRTDLEIGLVEVWQRVLKVERLGITDNFFEIGGDSLLALELVNEMERSTGIDFDLGLIFQASTIAKLIDALASGTSRVDSVVVPLRDDNPGRPVFCLCGINLYRPLANHLGARQPVLGIYAAEEQQLLQQTLEGGSASVSIERLANAYCDAIQRHQMGGPYRLTGLSFGGIIAIEVASQLKDRGEEVEVVILIDTLLRHAIRRNWRKWTVYQIKGLCTGHAFQKARGIYRRVRERIMLAVPLTRRSATKETQDAETVRALMTQNYLSAMGEYERAPYDGKVVLFRATGNHWHNAHDVDSDYGWGRYLQQPLEIRQSVGDHLSVIQEPNVGALANMLQAYLSD